MRPCNVVVADCGLLDTLAADGGHVGFQSLGTGAAHDVDDLSSPDAGLPFNDGICNCAL